MSHDYSKGPLARGPRGPFTKHSGDVHTIVEHYTWTLPTDGTKMADVAKWHAARNFNGPGYHIGVHPDGSLEYGRPLWARGAGAAGHNDRYIHVVWFGGRKRGSDNGFDTRTPAQIKELDQIYLELKSQFPTIKHIVGHRDLTPTQCPGYDVASWRAGRPQKPGLVRAAPIDDKNRPDVRPTSGLAALFARLFAWLGGR